MQSLHTKWPPASQGAALVTDISRVDLNLLVVFEAMLEHQNVTRAGQAMGLSQPAMSAALTKLRTLLNDPLYVRTGSGMMPTPHALRLAPAIARMLRIVRAEILQEWRFDPATSHRSFTLNTTDIGDMVFLPKLIRHLNTQAPGIMLKTVTLSPEETEEAMEAGDVDLSIGYFPDLIKAGFYQQRLFNHSFVCIVRADHPQLEDGALSLEQFLTMSHAVVHAQGRSQEIFEHELLKLGITRQMGLHTRHFMSLPMVIAESDLIATVPKVVGITFSKLANIRMLELPFEVPTYDLKQYWHRRFHRDAANVWMRGVIWELFHA
ncbi:LysR family transcriptional regulator [Eoetvoesiella caeni]